VLALVQVRARPHFSTAVVSKVLARFVGANMPVLGSAAPIQIRMPKTDRTLTTPVAEPGDPRPAGCHRGLRRPTCSLGQISYCMFAGMAPI
jgi:hypothetical protein